MKNNLKLGIAGLVLSLSMLGNPNNSKCAPPPMPIFPTPPPILPIPPPRIISEESNKELTSGDYALIIGLPLGSVAAGLGLGYYLTRDRSN